MYAWVITVDHLWNKKTDDEKKIYSDQGFKSEAGILGPAGCKLAAEEIIKKGEKFKMYDDDGELYYTGFFYDIDGQDCEAEFSPLDDFGTPNAGCVEIRYKNSKTGTWDTL